MKALLELFGPVQQDEDFDSIKMGSLRPRRSARGPTAK